MLKMTEAGKNDVFTKIKRIESHRSLLRADSVFFRFTGFAPAEGKFVPIGVHPYRFVVPFYTHKFFMFFMPFMVNPVFQSKIIRENPYQSVVAIIRVLFVPIRG